MIHRALLRLRHFLDLEVARLHRVPEWLALFVAALLVIAVIWATAAGADWAGILRGQAVNLASAAILAGFAYLLFVLRFRRGQLRTYLERQRRSARPAGRADQELDPLAATIVDELLDAKPPHAVLIIGPADAGQSHLLAAVTERLANKERVPVAVTLPTTYGEIALPALTRDRFVDELVGSSGDAQGGRRLFAGLVRSRRIVALLHGLDRVGQGEPLGARRDAIARLLQGSLAEGIPFVGWIHPDLAPSISEVAAFRTRPLPRAALVTYTLRQLEERNVQGLRDIESVLPRAFERGETTRDPFLLSLAADLVARRARAGERGAVAATTLFSDPCAFRRHLAWMCESALNCTLDGLERATTPQAVALAAIGREAHYRQEAELRTDDAVADLDPDGRRRFAAGLAVLAQRRVLDINQVDGSNRVRFTHPAWLAFAGAVGLRLNATYWRDLLRADISSATVDALTGALLIFGPDRLGERSFIRIFRDLDVPEGAEISLEMALAVITALQSTATPLDLGDREVEALERAWSTASDVAKTRFVRDVNFEKNPPLVDLLWSQVVPPRFHENSFRVRRAICNRLGMLGSSAWARLGPEWRRLLGGAESGDLSSWARRTDHWQKYGYAIASLAWTLPGVARSVAAEYEDEVFALLGALRRTVHGSPRTGGGGGRRPEIGLEISLAEGFKIAASENPAFRSPRDEGWCARATDFLDSSRSWISKQVLLQTLALVVPDRARIDAVVAPLEAAQREHPFVRETAALIRRAFLAEEDATRPTERDIWFEEVEARDDGGVNLSPQAHRLLGLSTLLINLAEWPFIAWVKEEEGAAESSVDARERAFTGSELPRCFVSRNHAATMFRTTCDCSFKFCGPDVSRRILDQTRKFSRSFLQRAQATARAPRLIRGFGGKGFAERGFAPVWRALDEELARGEPHLGADRSENTDVEKPDPSDRSSGVEPPTPRSSMEP